MQIWNKIASWTDDVIRRGNILGCGLLQGETLWENGGLHTYTAHIPAVTHIIILTAAHNVTSQQRWLARLLDHKTSMCVLLEWFQYFGSCLKYLQVQKCLLNWFEGCHGGQKALAKDWTGSWWATASGHSESIFTVSLLACDCYSATHSPLIYANPVMRVFRFWDKVFKVLRP